MKVKITYFKPSGKYYTEGEYETQKEFMHEIYDEADHMHLHETLPGVHHPYDFYALIEVPEHEHNVPHLLLPRICAR